MACQIGEHSEGITCPIQSQINLCCVQSLILLHDGSQDFSQFSDVCVTWSTYCILTWAGMTPQPPSARSTTIFVTVVNYFTGSAISSTCVLLPTLTEFWCSSVLQIVKATSRHASTAGKLLDIINLTKDVAMSSYFIDSLRFSFTRVKLPPFGVRAYSQIGRYKTSPWLWRHACYLETKFLWNKIGSDGISAAGHIAILEYYMFVLLTFVVDRYFPLFWILIFKTSPNNCTCRNLPNENRNLLVKQTGEVHWECHLLNTPASSSILQHLLTFHYLFTRRADLICVTVSEALGCLPLSFLKASLAWFRVSLDFSLRMNSVPIEISDSSGIIIESWTVIWRMSTIQKMVITLKNIETKTTKAKALKHGLRRSLPWRKFMALVFIK